MIRRILIALALITWPGGAHAQFASQQTFIATATGTANALILTVPNVGTLGDLLGVPIRFGAGFRNTGAATVAVSGLATKAITRADGTPLQAGDIPKAGAIITIIYDGTQFQEVNVSLVQQNLPTANTQVFTTSQTWTVPVGVTVVKQLQMWGGGGAGGGCFATGNPSAVSQAGAAGGYSLATNLAVTPLAGVAVVVGGGGAAHISGSTPGDNGGDTSMLGVSATGGGGGLAATNTVRTLQNTNGGVGSGGSFNLNGGNSGASFVGQLNAAFEGSGGAAYGGAPTPANFSAVAIAGTFPGGGGGSNACSTGFVAGPSAGGAGAAGLIVIQY